MPRINSCSVQGGIVSVSAEHMVALLPTQGPLSKVGGGGWSLARGDVFTLSEDYGRFRHSLPVVLLQRPTSLAHLWGRGYLEGLWE